MLRVGLPSDRIAENIVLEKSVKNNWRGQIFRVVFFQVFLTVSFGLCGLTVVSITTGKSAFIGGMVAVLPNYYLAKRMSVSYPEMPIVSLQRIYIGAFIKIVYTIALFALAIMFLDVEFIIMISSYFLVTLANWFGLKFLNLSENAEN